MRQSETTAQSICLLDLVAAVQDASQDDREAVAALRDLLEPARRPAHGGRQTPVRRRRGLLSLLTLALSAFLVTRGAQAAEGEAPVPGAAPEVIHATEAEAELAREQESETAGKVAARAESRGFVLLPSRAIYDPLIADPQWPRFAVAYQRYLGDPELENVGNVAFGGMLPVLQGDLPGEGRWELGVQAGVFSIFDLDGESSDLINSDFWVGLPFSVRWGWFSSILRVYHQSSHLGDEFLLRTGTDRVNLSYEAVDLIPSIDLWEWGRVYLGGGYLFNRNPEELKRKYVLFGGELKSPVALWGWLRPIAAGDVHRREEQDWRSDYSARAGFQFENAIFNSRRLLLLAEYYKGRSPNGQFFERRIEYWGVGLHFFF